MRTPLKYLSLFGWIALPLAGFWIYSAHGLPHAVLKYSFIPNGAPYDLDVPRTYTDCTYFGPYGSFTTGAPNGRCIWVRFFKPRGSQS